MAPAWIQRRVLTGVMNTRLDDAIFTPEEKAAVSLHLQLFLSAYSHSERIVYFQVMVGYYLIHPLTAADRLGNPDLPFPIGIAFGDRDVFGSQGADQIVRTSQFFKSGESQLFKIDNSCHTTHFDNPEHLSEVLLGFFLGTKKHYFEEKPRIEYTPKRTLE